MLDPKVKKLLDLSAESLGGAAGAFVGLVVAGPTGAIAGSALSPLVEAALKGTIGDMASREMSNRETRRVGTAAVHALNKVFERLIAGEKPREDSYFQPLGDDRSPGEVVFEGTLTICRTQWEERKVPWIANIVANAAFSDDAPPTVNRILVLAERMTWRQFYILAFAARYKEYGVSYD